MFFCMISDKVYIDLHLEMPTLMIEDLSEAVFLKIFLDMIGEFYDPYEVVDMILVLLYRP